MSRQNTIRARTRDPARARTIRAQYRRRQSTALLGALALLALTIGAVIGASGQSRSPHAALSAPAGTSYFAHLRKLASTLGASTSAPTTAQAAAINRTLGYTPYIQVAGGQHREIALTFDDGPGPYTSKILSVLEREHTPATFFEVGVMDNWFYDWTKQIIAHGWPIGDHTQTHAPMSKLSLETQRGQLLDQTKAIVRYGAPFPRLFRPPYGLWNDDTLALLKQYHMLMVLWTVDTDDYQLPGVDAIVRSAVNGARPGAIILLHDGGGNRTETADALPTIINTLRSRGYRLVTVPQLILDNPPPQKQPGATSGGS